jgi:GT2 family glycosyltransferase
MDDLAPGQPALDEAPPVVAVMVVCDPGPWFEESLTALAAQDYPALSILVVDAASTTDPTDRVAAAVPSAFVRRLHVDPGYAAAANEVLKVVKGASHLLFVHDDAAPAPDAVRLLLEAAYRGNAAITTPKLVAWDHPELLLAVGESVDPLGRPVSIVEPGEVDQGQHDAEREVLVAPGACLLVRADLFRRLGGFDRAAILGAEDLDLCWRAAVAGARTMTAPGARVRHRAALTNGERQSHLGDVRRLDLQLRLRAALVAATPVGFLVTLALAGASAVTEAVVAVVLGRRGNARMALGAFTSNLRSMGSLLGSRRRLAGLRKGGDPAAVRRLVARRGRLGALVREAGGDGGSGGERTGAEMLRRGTSGWGSIGLRRHIVALGALALVLLIGSRHLLREPMPQLGSLAALPEAPLELLRTYLGGARSAGMGGLGAAPPAFALLGLASIALLGATGLVGTLLVFGSLVAGVVGAARLARPLGSGRATATSAIAYAAVPLWPDALARGRLAGLVAYGLAPWLLLRLFRATGLAPFGADAPAEDGGTADVGLARAARRARRRAEANRPVPVLVGAGGAPPFEPFAPGELEGLDDPPLQAPELGWTSGEALTEVGAQHALDEMGAFDDDVDLDDLARVRVHHRGRAVRRLEPPPAPRRTRLQQIAALAVLLALGTALAPALLPAAAVAALGLLASVAIAGEAVGVIRAVRTAALGALGALVLLSPWSLSLLRAGQWSALTGPAGPLADAPRALDLLRFSAGPLPIGPLPLLLLLAALLPLTTGRSWRAAWAARCWAVALACFTVALVGGRGWLGLTGLEPGVLLPFAAAPVALAIALGAAAFEVDLRGFSFGWRQLASLGAAAAVALACLPMLLGVHSGRWGAPARDHADVLSWMPDKVGEGAFRVLWIGDPAALPLTGWHLGDGLAYATSRNGPPTAADQWAGPQQGIDERLIDPVRSARSNDVVDLGHRLAPLGVRYLVIPLRAAPVDAPERPVPADLPAALRAQVDLRQIDTNTSLLVFENAAWAPIRSQLPAEAAGAARDKKADVSTVDLSGAEPVLDPAKPGSARFQGDVQAGEVLVAEAPSSGWQLKADGRSAERHPAFGVVGFTVAAPGAATLQLRTPLLYRLAILVQALLWLAALVLVTGGSLGGAWPGGRARHLRIPGSPPMPPRPQGAGVVLLDPVGGAGVMAAGGPRSTFGGPPPRGGPGPATPSPDDVTDGDRSDAADDPGDEGPADDRDLLDDPDDVSAREDVDAWDEMEDGEDVPAREEEHARDDVQAWDDGGAWDDARDASDPGHLEDDADDWDDTGGPGGAAGADDREHPEGGVR